MLWFLPMRHARIVSGTGRDKTLTSGIFALTAQDGLDRIMLRSGLNRPVAKFVASASEDALRETGRSKASLWPQSPSELNQPISNVRSHILFS
jgi:hypothetical protein